MNKTEFTEAFAVAILAQREAAKEPIDAGGFIRRRDSAWCDYLALLSHPEYKR